MTAGTKTVRELIDELTRETGQTEEFAQTVRAMFEGKGIDLDSDCAIYEKPVREAFACQVELGIAARRAEAGLRALDDSFQRLRQSCVGLANEVRELRAKCLVQQARLIARDHEPEEDEERDDAPAPQGPAHLLN